MCKRVAEYRRIDAALFRPMSCDTRPVAREPSALHIGNHLPRPLIVTVDTCEGPRAYVGVASVFQQKLVEGTSRMTDMEWSDAI